MNVCGRSSAIAPLADAPVSVSAVRVSRELAFVAEVALRGDRGADVLHAVVALAVVQQRRVERPAAGFLFCGDRRRDGGAEQCAGGRGERSVEFWSFVMCVFCDQLQPQPPPPKPRPPLEASLLK